MSGLTDIFRELRKDSLGFAGLIIVTIIILASVFAPLLAPHDPLAVDVYNRLASPSWEHWLGTDQLLSLIHI